MKRFTAINRARAIAIAKSRGLRATSMLVWPTLLARRANTGNIAIATGWNGTFFRLFTGIPDDTQVKHSANYEEGNEIEL